MFIKIKITILVIKRNKVDIITISFELKPYDKYYGYIRRFETITEDTKKLIKILKLVFRVL